MVIDRPLSWPLACFGLKLHHLQGRPIGANNFMANAFEKALLPNQCCHSVVTCVPEQRRVSMRVYYIVNLSRRPGTLGVSFLWELLFIPCITEVRRYVNDGLALVHFKCVLVCVCASFRILFSMEFVWPNVQPRVYIPRCQGNREGVEFHNQCLTAIRGPLWC